MKGAILYFSLTGNTKLACKYIKEKIKNVEFELLDMRGGYYDLSNYDIVGFATYADEYTVAEFVKNYIENMKSINKIAFVFSTFGQKNGACTRDLAKYISKRGFKVVCDHALNTPENYPPVIMRSHGHINNPTDKQMLEFNEFIKELSNICIKISSKEDVQEKKVDIQMKYSILSKLGNPSMMRAIMGKKKIDPSLCIRCKKCVSACPYDVIKMDSYPIFDESKCHGCFACYNLCPTQAIYTKAYNKFSHYPEPSKAVIEKLKV